MKSSPHGVERERERGGFSILFSKLEFPLFKPFKLFFVTV